MGNKKSKLKRSQPSQPSPDASGGSYFTPLPSARHIRLIDLSAKEDQITITHSIVSLEEAPTFYALSYTWGIPTQRDLDLRMQNPDVPVTENLGSALYFLGTLVPGKYWIDALCINQRDDAEKSSQVALMRDIYSAAKVVIMFLGPKDDESTMACHLVAKLCELFQDGTMDLEGGSIQRSLSVAKKYPFEDKKLQELGLPLSDAPDWIALASLLSKPYFERIWVLQELVMATSIVVFCGSFQLPWAALEMTYRVLLATGWNFELKRLASQHYRQLELQALDFLPIATTLKHSPGKKLGLLMLLDVARVLLATDPKDKIIALLGMAIEAENSDMSLALRPDYGKSVQQVYTEFTGTLITGSNFDLLSSVERKAFRQIKHLPSWVPDYSATSHNGSFAKGYAAGGNFPVSATWARGSSELKVKAFVADAVREVSPHSIGSRHEDSTSPEEFLLEIFTMAARYFGPHERAEFIWLDILAQGHSEVHLEALWQTLVGVGNTLRSNSPAPSELRNSFASCMARNFVSLRWDRSNEVRERLGAIDPGLLTMGDPQLFISQCLDNLIGNRFFITEDDKMGLATEDLKPGDKVMVFSGASPIYIVRECKGHHQYIGDGYVYGLMSGEAVSGKDNHFVDIVLK